MHLELYGCWVLIEFSVTGNRLGSLRPASDVMEFPCTQKNAPSDLSFISCLFLHYPHVLRFNQTACIMGRFIQLLALGGKEYLFVQNLQSA